MRMMNREYRKLAKWLTIFVLAFYLLLIVVVTLDIGLLILGVRTVVAGNPVGLVWIAVAVVSLLTVALPYRRTR